MNNVAYRYRLSIWLLINLVWVSHLHAQESDLLQGQVSLLSLDQELHARSQLGGLTVDRLGYIYVANFHDAVWKVSPKGEVKLLTDGLYGASGNAIDAKGNLYQANFFAHSIVKIDRFGNISNFLEQGLDGPVGLIFDVHKNLYVCNFNQNNILKISPEKHISIFAEGPHFNGPNGITIDKEGCLYVVNFNDNQIIKLSPEGEPSVFADVPGTDGNAHITFYNDRLFVTKIKSNQVFQLNKTGSVKLLAGTGQTGLTEGNALEVLFSAPNGIGVDTQTGDLYVNNVNGQWTSQQPSTIEISKIELQTLPRMLSHYLDQQDTEQAKKLFKTYLEDPFHAGEDVGPAIGSLGWQYMAKRNVTGALTLFHLLESAYPDRWQSFFFLGDVYKIIGQLDRAKSYYQQALKIQPQNQILVERLKALE